jgi:Short C-terminal domain
MLMRRPIARAAVGTAVIAGTATAVSGRVARRQEARAEEAQAEAYAPPPQAPAPAPPPASTGVSPEAISQLQQLAALKDQGILTEEEFAAQKAKILGE